ncbi:hypothetical protein L3C95_29365 [Chitinophaga filiformis]|uniref:hypothetical protein n=1 Tax=Chitinophaga filiformis TaxID=104663 RepID=UPI001F30A6C5|nr:hypothetical protein [Chitinophaga filiformis]MCF6407042.1 hypothetical protein [Chitinophaga filiformis]
MKRMKKLVNVLHHFLYTSRKAQQSDLLLLGTLLARQNKELPVLDNISAAEFKVFSQTGDDGIIQYLINKVYIPETTFIEFGVENYVESNTRFLLKYNNWSGLVIDGSKKSIRYIMSDDIYYQHDLKAVQAFITAENINDLIGVHGMKGEIGLLSVDIDGNDYWVWKAIDVVDPVIVVAEYNSVFGIDRAITVPYKPDFIREQAHYSHLYFGASLKALCVLAEEKGYAFVGSNSIGNNAYFVKKNRLGGLRALSAEEGYVYSRFRESRDKKGNLNYLSGAERYECIKGLSVYNVMTGLEEKL